MATFITIPEEDNEELLKNDALSFWLDTFEECAEREAFSKAVGQIHWEPRSISSVYDHGKVGFNTIAR